MSNSSRRPLSALTDAQLLEELDELVMAAARGERHAVLALSIGFGPLLLAEAKRSLGQVWAREAAGVLADLFTAMLRGTLEFVPGRDRGQAWLRAQLRAIAAQRRAGAQPS